MQTKSNHERSLPVEGLKQVKVDNWGTFFLQRLLQLYFNEELLDLNIKFLTCTSELKVHRLVIATCTDYFLRLERDQKENNSAIDNVIIMPSDMPYECVKSIISFMYTGQLEYWTSEQNALYQTAQKMNMSVLTKLLDAQGNSSNPINFAVQKVRCKPFVLEPKHSTSSERKFPVWKRKLNSHPEKLIAKQNSEPYSSRTERSNSMENTGGPSRFDLPEIEELTLGVFSSFDDITYNTKPIAQAPEQICSDTRKDYEETRNSISGMFESLIGDENYIKIQRKKDDSSDGDSIEQDSILKFEDFRTASIKKVRFDFDAEENLNKSYNTHSNTSENADDNHAKIVREVLKKYPYLVRHNKNIRLKIMQKESKTTENLTQNKTKVSYLVLKSDSLMTNDDNEALSKNLNDCYLETNDIGPWKCSRCNLDQQYSNYYMYRRHMQDVHSERFDPRICEHCGYKATKRNILMYHMYTKHNVPPPRNMSFPKCEVCSYVALSESLLIRHQINHRHQLSPSNLHRLNTKSIECSQYEGSLTNTTESTYHEITTAHGTSLNRKQKEHRCLYCGKQFSKMHNLESHIGCHHNNLEKYECVSELQPSSESSTEVEAFRNIPCDIATSVNIGNESQQSNINDKELSISQVNNDDPSNQQIVMLINNEEYQHQYFKDDYPFNISTNDEILVRHSDGNVIIYIENTNENQSSEELGKNVVNKNCEYPHSNNDIVEEVVEELEAIEDDKVEKLINHTNSQIMFKEEVDICRADYGFDLNRMKNNSSDFGETIQYVEEETEILEYETSSNV